MILSCWEEQLPKEAISLAKSLDSPFQSPEMACLLLFCFYFLCAKSLLLQGIFVFPDWVSHIRAADGMGLTNGLQ